MGSMFGSSGLGLAVIGAGTAFMGFVGGKTFTAATGAPLPADAALMVGGGAVAAIGVAHMVANK